MLEKGTMPIRKAVDRAVQMAAGLGATLEDAALAHWKMAFERRADPLPLMLSSLFVDETA